MLKVSRNRDNTWGFGLGILYGRSASGTLPHIRVVTSVSPLYESFYLLIFSFINAMPILHTEQLLENSYLLKNSPRTEIYAYFRIKAAKVEPKGERAPLNISVVLDRSGSMQGDKLEYVKKATDFIVRNLNSSDTLSIVQYDDTVDVVSPSSSVRDKDALHKKIAAIVAGGMTNLSGGMMEGYHQVKTARRDGAVHRVLLLSDGLANVGITEPEALQRIASQHFREQGIGLSTFGVGEGFNELLMTALSEHGGANYYFIETPDQIPQIFAKELSGLLAVVAQNVRLSLSLPWGLRCEKVYGYPADVQSDRVQILFNDLFSGEEKVVVMKLRLEQPAGNALELGVLWQFDDMVETLSKQEMRYTLTLQSTEDAALADRSLQRVVVENSVQFVANERFDAVMQDVDGGNFERARKNLDELLAYLEANLRLFPGSEILQKQFEQIRAYRDRLGDLEHQKLYARDEYMVAQKMSRMANYSLRKRKE